MKVVILAGGFGSRLHEETYLKPKPMVEIGGKPILWHIMKIYSYYGFNEFIICLGYKGYMIKEYFTNYFSHVNDLTIELASNKIIQHNNRSEDFKITLVDTGLSTQTGGRIKRIKKYINESTFMMTYGDGVANINIKKLIDFHIKNGKLATITAVKPVSRFGALKVLDNSIVDNFEEKPVVDGSWINGGFFVLDNKIFDYIKGDDTSWEDKPLKDLAKNVELVAYKHLDFWKPMDTLREKRELEKLWNLGKAPWKIW